jgi:L-amino acid N-acyltransferase YncA
MTASFLIREAEETDIAQLTEIYAHHVRTGTSSFEIEPPDEAEMKARWSRIRSAGLPYVVAESAGRLLGYCYVSWYRPRRAYRYTLENSVYVSADSMRMGVGRALLEHMLGVCREKGYHEIIAIIGDSANQSSIGLHRRSGFVHVGTLKNVGFKFDRWLDSVIMQCSLQEWTDH